FKYHTNGVMSGNPPSNVCNHNKCFKLNYTGNFYNSISLFYNKCNLHITEVPRLLFDNSH
ncbi:hypothetical protein L9F63_020411, partial [Diploptera punctata]